MRASTYNNSNDMIVTMRRACVWMMVLSLSLLLPFAPVVAQPESVHRLCFYNPATNINHYASLKTEFDTYLAASGPYRFQPFANRTAFERFILNENSNVFMISSSHYQQLAGSAAVHAVLVGVSSGRSTYREILSAKTGIDNLADLSGKELASSANKARVIQQLLAMFGESQRKMIDSIHILTVPKDIDALMAISFGMASAALTTKRSVDLLKSININQYRMLHPLGVSAEILQPVVAVINPDMEDNALIASVKQMGNTTEGKKGLNMLGLDSFRKLTASEMKQLNP